MSHWIPACITEVLVTVDAESYIQQHKSSKVRIDTFEISTDWTGVMMLVGRKINEF